MTFNHNGLHFEAYEGGLIVKKDGELQLQAIDVFRNGVPAAEKVVKFYEATMTKKELLKELEGLDDDAYIFVYVNEHYYCIKGSEDKIAGCKMQNEITLICD